MRIEIKEEAREHLASIFAFNLNRSFGWAERVEACLFERCEALLRTPQIGRPMPEPAFADFP